MIELSTTQRKTACNRDCGDACSMIATIENGRVIRLQGDPDHPVTRGFLCHRTSRFLERQYHPDRLTTPLMKRDSGFEPVSWDEALDCIAETMLRIREEDGGAALMHYRCGGSMGLLKSVTDYFFERFGPITTSTGDICTGAGSAAQMTDFGEEDSNDLFDLLNSKTIILWGRNPYVSQVHLLPVLKDAKKNGARLILIDPVRHRTADLCDLYVQPRPGGDMALALAVARLMFERGQTDPAAASYCDHVNEFRALAESRSVAEWSRLADVDEATIRQLADQYADGPSAIVVGWGLQRRANGSAAVRVIDALGAVSGNIGVAGGGVSYYFKRRGAFDTSFSKRDQTAPRTIPEPLLGPGILEASDPPIRMLWVTAANPVAMLPDSNAVAKALSTRELTVVVDQFLTDSARCADIVLPTTTMLEEDDLLGAYGHHWIAEMRAVVDAPEGVQTDFAITQVLASRVGLGDEFSEDIDTWKRRLLKPVADKGGSLEELREQPVRNPLSKKIIFEDRQFPTESGKINLIQNSNPTPPATTADRPLLLMAASSENVQGSQWLPGDDDGPIPATVHPDCAPGLKDGDEATIESEVGSMTVRLRFDDRQRKDIALLPKGGWLRQGRCANALIRAEVTDAGGCAVYYDTPVRIVP